MKESEGVSLCKFKSGLIYARIAKPLILPLLFFALYKTMHFFKKITRTKLAASEATWRLPSSPIVKENVGVSSCKFKSGLIYTRIAKPYILPWLCFSPCIKQYTFSKKTRTKFAGSEATWRLPSSPIVKKNLCMFYVVVVAVVVVVVVAVDVVVVVTVNGA